MTVHFIGIGGAGMSGIARILLARGVRVSGLRRPGLARRARAAGARRARCEVGHDPAHLPEPPATVVVSTAIRESNPELAAARERGLPVVHRATALAALTAGRRLAAVAGTHGQDLDHVDAHRRAAALRARPVVRDRRRPRPPPAPAPTQGTGDIFVVEADESDALVPGVLAGRSRSSPTSRPTTSTTTAPRRPTSPRSTQFLGRIAPGRHARRLRRRPRRRRARRHRARDAGSPCAPTGGPRRPTRGSLDVPARTAPAPASAAALDGAELRLRLPGPRRAHGAQRAGRAAGRASSWAHRRTA